MTITGTGSYSGSNTISWEIDTVTQPTSVVATSSSGYATYVHLTWSASTSLDGGIYYKVYRDSTFIGTSPSPGYFDLSVPTGTAHNYYVVGYDSTGVSSTNSATVSATVTSGTSIGSLLGITTGSSDSITASPLNFQVLQPLQ